MWGLGGKTGAKSGNREEGAEVLGGGDNLGMRVPDAIFHFGGCALPVNEVSMATGGIQAHFPDATTPSSPVATRPASGPAGLLCLWHQASPLFTSLLRPPLLPGPQTTGTWGQPAAAAALLGNQVGGTAMTGGPQAQRWQLRGWRCSGWSGWHSLLLPPCPPGLGAWEAAVYTDTATLAKLPAVFFTSASPLIGG